MAREICGCFETEEEAVNVINALSLKGFPADRIRVYTSQEDPRDLARETDGYIIHVQDGLNERKTSRFAKLFTKISDCDVDITHQLRKDGLSERQAEKHANDISKGNILVVVDNKLKMGHQHTTNVEFGMESPLVHHSKYHE